MQFTTRKMEDCLSRPCRNNIAPILMLSTISKTKKNRKKQLNVFLKKIYIVLTMKPLNPMNKTLDSIFISNKLQINKFITTNYKPI